MSYVGSAPSPSQVQFSTLDAQAFNGDGSTTAFTLNRAVSIAASIEVTVNNVQQSPYDGSYTVNGTTTLTFSEAPSSGTDNIYVRFLDYPLASITPGNDTVGLDQLSATGTPSSSTYLRGDNTWATISSTLAGLTDVTVSTSDPAVTTNPTSGTGHLWINKTSGEAYICTDATTDANVWTNIGDGSGSINPTYTVEYFIVAGGGGGGAQVGGGGGAGGYLTGTSGDLSPGTGYSITVGAGGTNVNGNNQTAGSGGSSSAFGFTAIGGGRGGTYNGPASGASGGSGGGASTSGSGGSGTSGQGYAGGGNDGSVGGGGGGGAGAVGTGGSGSVGGAGGVGVASSISGSSTYYAGGGGGAGNSGVASGGTGGGGAGGSNSPATSGTSGTANTGGGGGGARDYYPSGSGGSGVVIIRYLGDQKGTGGTVTSSGGYTIHTFTTSGTYTA